MDCSSTVNASCLHFFVNEQILSAASFSRSLAESNLVSSDVNIREVVDVTEKIVEAAIRFRVECIIKFRNNMSSEVQSYHTCNRESTRIHAEVSHQWLEQAKKQVNYFWDVLLSDTD